MVMKKLIALFILLMLIGCSAPKSTEQLNETVVAEPSEQVAVAEPSEQVAEPDSGASEQAEKEERKQVLDDSLKEKVIQEQEQKIIETLENPPALPQRNRTTIAGEMWQVFSGIASYKFKTTTGTYYSRGDKVRAILRNPATKRGIIQNGRLYDEIIIDEVILDRAGKTAMGYCFGYTELTRSNCASLKIDDKTGFNVSYDEFAIKMPDEWTRDYMTEKVSEEEHEKYFLESIETIRAKFSDGVEIYFNPLAGLPIKIIKGPLETIKFDGLTINQARPEDVIHRSRSEIPQTEAFYKQIY